MTGSGAESDRRLLPSVSLPRKVVAPVVIVVWVITALVAGYTCAVLSWLFGYRPYLGTSGIFEWFVRSHSVSVPLGLAVVGFGIRLLCLSETSVVHLAWYSSVGISLAAAWLTWVLFV